MAVLLTGGPVAEHIRQSVRYQREILEQYKVTPTLALVRVGARENDIAYERSILKQAAELQIRVKRFLLPEKVLSCQATDVLQQINADPEIHGCLVFRPLPGHLDTETVVNTLDVQKDIDAMATSIRYLRGQGNLDYAPCTAAACLKLLEYYNIPLKGKKAVVIGKGPAVGFPVALLLLNAEATVSVCHILTAEQDIKQFCQNADLIISAAGNPGMIRRDMVRPGQTVVDVGISLGSDGKLYGDVAYDEVAPVVTAIAPVSGGVGIVTTAVLMEHTVRAAYSFIQGAAG